MKCLRKVKDSPCLAGKEGESRFPRQTPFLKKNKTKQESRSMVNYNWLLFGPMIRLLCGKRISGRRALRSRPSAGHARAVFLKD